MTHQQKSNYWAVWNGRLLALLALCAACFLPRPASAQCSREAPLGFQNISPEPNNPFEAEYSVNIRSAVPARSDALGSVLRFAARDSRGRVRVEHSHGKYQVQRADGTQSSEERLSIFLCDPTTGVYVHLDTLNKTANIRPAAEVRQAPPAGSPLPFCARMFDLRTRNHDVQTKDLGHQLVAGLDAGGLRFLSPLRAEFDATPSFTYTDTWCSEDLAAIVAVVVVSANGDHRRETVPVKISRKEPDPALFEIPAGYTVVQRKDSAAGPTKPSGFGDSGSSR